MKEIIKKIFLCNDGCDSIVNDRSLGIVPRGVGGQTHNPDLMVIGLNPGRSKTFERFLYKKYGKSEGPELLKQLTEQYFVDCDNNSYSEKMNVLLTDIFDNEFIQRVYFTELVKCQSCDNGKIKEKTINHCFSKFLKEEIEILKPKVILALGRKVQKYLRDQGIHCINCIHPSAVGNALKFWMPSSKERASKVKEIKDALKRGL